MVGYGIKVQTDTGHFLWLTETGTSKVKTAKGVIRYESELGAYLYRNSLAANNPHVTLIVKKF